MRSNYRCDNHQLAHQNLRNGTRSSYVGGMAKCASRLFGYTIQVDVSSLTNRGAR
jgi:hypothetical protein